MAETTDLQVVDSQEYDPEQRDKMVAVKYNSATIETVKRSIFPGSTDDELRIFLYKCLIFGVHPLSGMLIPVVYDTTAGRKLSFTTTIDCFRSKAQESGEYDGQDGAEVLGMESFDHEGVTINHPIECKVNVYRKNISRPFVGSARWDEFYPGEKRGTMWRKMPRTMLAKCAEAQAIRKAFPDKLNRIYAVEEMEQAANDMAAPASSTTRKDAIAPPPAAVGSDVSPDEATRKRNKWISVGQENRLYAICKAKGVEAADVKAYLRGLPKPIAHFWEISWSCPKGQKSNYDRLCEKVEAEPAFFAGLAAKSAAEAKPEPAPAQTAQEAPGSAQGQGGTQTTPEPSNAPAAAPATTPDAKRKGFEIQVDAMVSEIGLDAAGLDKEIGEIANGATYANVTSNYFTPVLVRLNTLLEEKTNHAA